MAQEVKLSRVRSVLEELDYPVTRVDAATELEPYRITHAGGDDNLGALVSEVGSDAFDSAEELDSELQGVLPLEALGELGESEGDG